MGRYLDIAKLVEAPKRVVATSREEIRQALKRLECGEAEAIRFYSRTCGGQFLVLRNDHIPESLEIDCPTFTRNELKELIGADKEHLRAVYELKRAFPEIAVEVNS